MAPESAGIDSRQIAVRDARRWFAIGVGSVAVAGCFALYLAIARIPGLETALSPDPEFGHRGLVVHVNLALGVWFSSCIAALFCLLPGTRRMRYTPAAQLAALVGIGTFAAAMFLPEATALKSNYVPTLDHWVFVLGISVFGLAVGCSFVDSRLFLFRGSSLLPKEAQNGLRLAAIAYLFFILTVWGAHETQSSVFTPLQYYERLFWGGGHIQQWANVLAMISAWLILLSRITNKQVVNPALATVLFVLLAAPVVAGPWLTYTLQPPQYFTLLMRWGIFPVVSVFVVLCASHLWRERHNVPSAVRRGPAFTGFAVSAAMTVAGFVMGSLIRDNSTLVPAHYHMSLGAVTAAFMATLLELIGPLGAPLPSARVRKWAGWQPVLYGFGMAMMAIGFGLAGSVRKTYGTEQVVRGAREWAGLFTMGVGGVISSIGGIAFLVILIVSVQAALKQKSQTSL